MSGQTQLSLYGVSCAAPTSCLINGSGGLGGGDYSSLIAWDGTDFARVAKGSSGVDCVATDYCVLGSGRGTSESHTQPLAYLWNGTSLKRMQTPFKAGGYGDMRTIDCWAEERCVAVTGYGYAYLDGGTRWHWQRLADQRSGNTQMDSLRCFSNGRCLGVGGNSYDTDGARYWTGRFGERLRAHSTAPRGGSMTEMSCTGSRDCAAIVTYDRYVGDHFMKPSRIATWNGRTWTLQEKFPLRWLPLDLYVGAHRIVVAGCVVTPKSDYNVDLSPAVFEHQR
jgi:hypothetical protein